MTKKITRFCENVTHFVIDESILQFNCKVKLISYGVCLIHS